MILPIITFIAGLIVGFISASAMIVKGDPYYDWDAMDDSDLLREFMERDKL